MQNVLVLPIFPQVVNYRLPSAYMRCLILIILVIAAAFTSVAQTDFSSFISRSDRVNSNRAREKVFIHYDRPHYNLGDTLWARGYIASAYDHSFSDSSRLVYLEVIDARGKIINRISTNSILGQFDASIALEEDRYTEGTYLLRAYTQWMRNFGDSLFYQSYFKILDFKNPRWQTVIRKLDLTGNRLQLQAQVKPPAGLPQQAQAVKVIVRSRRRRMLTLAGWSDGAGNFVMDTLIPKVTHKKYLSIELLKDDRSLATLPISITSPQPADLQFLPEGGSFVAGIPQRLGFKATNAYGKGMDVKGMIKDSSGATVTSFATIHNGMGILSFTPKNNEKYTAVLENGLIFELPRPDSQGICLSVAEQPDSLLVQVNATAGFLQAELYLAATTRGMAYVRGKMTLKNGMYKIKLPKTAFPSGVVRFTVYNSQLLPLCERAVFLWHKDDMNLQLVADKLVYSTRDSVNLAVQINNYNPADSLAFFSLAVIDTSQISYSKYRENIVSYMLLSSDLKGEVEDPYYYFSDPAPNALEALMLTQGWVRYNWHSDSSFRFEREMEFAVSGHITNYTKKGKIEGIDLLLKGKRGTEENFVKVTTTEKGGRFLFDGFPPIGDSTGFSIKAFEQNRKSLAGILDGIKSIQIDELPPYQLPEELRYEAGLLELDTAVRAYVNKQVNFKRGDDYLEEVVVQARGRIPGSYLVGTADWVFADFEEENYTFDNYFRAEIGGHLPHPNLAYGGAKNVRSHILLFFVDGVLGGLDQGMTPGVSWSWDTKQYMDSAISSSYLKWYNMQNDIKAIEVVTKQKPARDYLDTFDWWDRPFSNQTMLLFYVVHVTTYSGKGPGMYRPNPFVTSERYYYPLLPTIAKEFYQPKYSTPLQEDEIPLLPATVYWKNYLMADHKGAFHAGFYTSDSPGNYLIIVQGINNNGQLGFLQQSLLIEKPPE